LGEEDPNVAGRPSDKPASPANIHRSCLAHQKQGRDANRNRDSLYGARRKNEIGKQAARTTVLRTIRSENSNEVNE
jgi:hypothetical protein